ncbi:MAG: Uma2 family endonuclease [Gemmataceae bacterium]|nr:Uma2 family endonuclease [Gemmataceae bacterium]
MNAVLTPEAPPEIQAIPSNLHFEIVDGQIVEMPPVSILANIVAYRLATSIDRHAKKENLGFAISEILFKLDLPVDRRRRPDAAFVSRNRWPAEKGIPDGNSFPLTPDLLIEVVSPTDLAEEVQLKIREYFEAGAVEVWIVYPKQGTIELFDSPTSSRWLTRDDALENVPFLPGFRLALSEVFSPDLA